MCPPQTLQAARREGIQPNSHIPLVLRGLALQIDGQMVVHVDSSKVGENELELRKRFAAQSSPRAKVLAYTLQICDILGLLY